MLFMNNENHSRQCVQEVYKSNAKVLTGNCNMRFDMARIHRHVTDESPCK